jgi:hypothetical protein
MRAPGLRDALRDLPDIPVVFQTRGSDYEISKITAVIDLDEYGNVKDTSQVRVTLWRVEE